MIRYRHATLIALLLAGNLILTPTSYRVARADTPPGYTIADLSPLMTAAAVPRAINNAGQVVGDLVAASGAQHAFLSVGGVLRDLGTLGGTNSSATGINTAGQVVGWSDMPGDLTRVAFVYDESGGMRPLNLGRGPHSYATAINVDGQIVGSWGLIGTPFQQAFLLGPGRDILLGSLGGVGSIANAINDSGQIAGLAATVSGQWHAFRTAPLAAINPSTDDLSTLPGGLGSWANGINAAGDVVGGAWLGGTGAYHAFLFAAGRMRDLGTLGGQRSQAHAIQAHAINAIGQIVGESTLPGDQASRAFLHIDGTMRDLNNFLPTNSGWVLESALAISDDGQIVGRGTYGRRPRAFLLKPVPVPPTDDPFGRTDCNAIRTGGKPVDYPPFSASSGDVLLIRMVNTSGTIDPLVRLLYKGEKILEESKYPCVEVTATLTFDGQYLLQAGDGGGYKLDTGDFCLYLQRTNNPGHQTAIAYERPIPSGISLDAEMETYTFTPSAGDFITIKVERLPPLTLDPLVRLYDPRGTLIAEDRGLSPQISKRLTDPRRHTILVGSSSCRGTGGYEVTLTKQSP
jgi:probable HAF family extracellular repeat protein